ncbi:MAG: serine hydrolase domain-containing protein [Bryobacteraceae bacterium]
MPITRRRFAASLAAAGAPAAGGLDAAIRQSMDRNGVPCVTAMVANSKEVLYQGAFGTRDAGSAAPVKIDSIFGIASMTKAITSVAALRLVEQKRVALDEPAERHLAELRGRQVLSGFDAKGRPVLRAPKRAVTLHHLLSHTSGLAYGLWDREVDRWSKSEGVTASTPQPLAFDPGTRWQYGQGIDVAGRLVERLSGLTLEDYFQRHILGPLGMDDTSFILPASKFDRLVTGYRRQADGALKPNERKQPDPPKSFNGGGGLYSTAPDYIRFGQLILRRGEGIFSPETYRLLSTNQTGRLRAGILKTTNPAVSADMDVHPGASDRYTLGFLLNPAPHVRGRAAGSLAWAGISNTFYWIDPGSDRCAVIMMQFLPFVDPKAIAVLKDFEQAVYA